jgi:hypothetical protein
VALHPDDLVAELAEVGVRVRDVWDLVNTSARYPDAIPVLLRWLDRVEEVPAEIEAKAKLREGLVRAVSVSYARPAAARPVIAQFSRVADPSGLGIGWVLGNALRTVADESVADELAALLRDRRLGRAREQIFEAVPRIAKARPDIVPLVRSLLDDETVRAFVIAALGQVRDTESRDQIARYLDSEHVLTRRNAKTAVRRLDAELARKAAY